MKANGPSNGLNSIHKRIKALRKVSIKQVNVYDAAHSLTTGINCSALFAISAANVTPTVSGDHLLIVQQ